MPEVSCAVRMAVVLAPTPTKKKDVGACETRTLIAFRMAEAEAMADAQKALRLRCRSCRFASLSPILDLQAEPVVAVQ